MPDKKRLLVPFVVSMIVGLLMVVPMNDMSLFSADGMTYALIGGLAIFLGPIILCSIPAGVHWLIWREKLEGNQLAIYTFWVLAWFNTIFVTIGGMIFN